LSTYLRLGLDEQKREIRTLMSKVSMLNELVGSPDLLSGLTDRSMNTLTVFGMTAHLAHEFQNVSKVYSMCSERLDKNEIAVAAMRQSIDDCKAQVDEELLSAAAGFGGIGAIVDEIHQLRQRRESDQQVQQQGAHALLSAAADFRRLEVRLEDVEAISVRAEIAANDIKALAEEGLSEMTQRWNSEKEQSQKNQARTREILEKAQVLMEQDFRTLQSRSEAQDDQFRRLEVELQSQTQGYSDICTQLANETQERKRWQSMFQAELGAINSSIDEGLRSSFDRLKASVTNELNTISSRIENDFASTAAIRDVKLQHEAMECSVLQELDNMEGRLRMMESVSGPSNTISGGHLDPAIFIGSHATDISFSSGLERIRKRHLPADVLAGAIENSFAGSKLDQSLMMLKASLFPADIDAQSEAS
jgi:hypothetical protein